MLVDALVGLAVIVVTLTLASEAVQSGLSRAHRQEEVRWAVLEARSRLAEVGADIPLREGRMAGRDGPLAWTLDIAPSVLGAGLFEAQVSVSDAQGRRLAFLRTLRSAA